MWVFLMLFAGVLLVSAKKSLVFVSLFQLLFVSEVVVCEPEFKGIQLNIFRYVSDQVV